MSVGNVPMPRRGSYQALARHKGKSHSPTKGATERAAVRLDNLPADLEPTHLNLNDHTLEGMRHRHLPVFSVQYHPEASAGPHDSSYLFEEFAELLDAQGKKA